MRKENKTKRWSQIRSTNWGFVKKNVGGFRYKPRGDWFSFAKVRKLCFLCSCKQTCETSISQRRARATHTSYVIHRNGFHIWQIAEVREKHLLHLKYGYFSYKNAWIRYKRPLFMPRSCVRHILLFDVRTSFGLLNKNTHRNDNDWNSQDNF